MGNDINYIMERDERIARYLKGLMTAEEETAFLADIESDEQLKQDAIAQALLVKGMAQVDNELIQELKNISESNIASLVCRKRIIYMKPITWLYAAASVVLLLFTGYKGYDYYDTTRLGMEYATSFSMGTLVRGDRDSDTDTELMTLFENVVNRKDLSSTTKRLSELWEISNQEAYNDYTDYASYIGWYLAIGYLENYEKEKARRVLVQLLMQQDGCSKALYDEVTILLDKIE